MRKRSRKEKVIPKPEELYSRDTERFIDILCRNFLITIDELFGHTKLEPPSRARSCLIKWLTSRGFTQKDISAFVERDHCCVHLSVKTYADDIRSNPVYKNLYTNTIREYEGLPPISTPYDVILKTVSLYYCVSPETVLSRGNNACSNPFLMLFGLLPQFYCADFIRRLTGVTLPYSRAFRIRLYYNKAFHNDYIAISDKITQSFAPKPIDNRKHHT